jgi:L-aspartate oxidase
MTVEAHVVHVDGPVIIGAGLAGLMTAIELSPIPCIVLSAGPITTGTSTGWAQGGVAAAVGPDDSPALHTADTLAAGAGLCELDAVERITAAGPGAIERMAQVGTRFDRFPDGTFVLGLEGAHSRRRIVHAQGDMTGAELLRSCVEKARELPSVNLWDNAWGSEIVVRDGRVVGLRIELGGGSSFDTLMDASGPGRNRTGGTSVIIETDRVVLATGGIGGLYQHTTNPLSSRGGGLALAARAGAVCRDVEMVQFHPTALDVGVDPMPLVSEAVRGEGAIVVDETGARVIENPLSARDVVSRAEWAALQAGHQVFLDARTDPGERFASRFPGILKILSDVGIDPTTDLLPVRPAAHYHMGGVLVDAAGRTTVEGLYAVGEVSSTGLHGANRLASNSLLEAIVCARLVAADLRLGAVQNPLPKPVVTHTVNVADARTQTPRADVEEVRAIMSRYCGVLRDEAGLAEAMHALRDHVDTDEGLVGYMLASSALTRRESRGGHTRTDYAQLDPTAEHTLIDLADVLDDPE